MSDYQGKLNGIASIGINKPTYYPDPSLAIELAGNHAPIPITVTKVARPKERLYTQANTNSYAGMGGRGPVSETTPTKDFYLGEGVEY